MPTFYPEGSKANGYILKGGEWVEDAPVAPTSRPEVLPEGIGRAVDYLTPSTNTPANIIGGLTSMTRTLGDAVGAKMKPEAQSLIDQADPNSLGYLAGSFADPAMGAIAGVALKGIGKLDAMAGHPAYSALQRATEYISTKTVGGADAIVAKARNLMPKSTPERLAQSSEAESLGLKMPLSAKLESPALEKLGMLRDSSAIGSGAAKVTGMGSVAPSNADRLRQIAMKDAGISAESLTPAVLDSHMANLGSRFSDTGDFAIASMPKADVKTVLMDSMGEGFTNAAKVRTQVGKMVDDYKGDATGLTGTDLINLQSNLGAMTKGGSLKGGGKQAVGNAQQSLIDNFIPKQSGNISQEFRALQSQYKHSLALTKALKSRGQLNVNPLLKMGGAPSDTKKAASLLKDFGQTAYGTENAARGGLLGEAVVGTGLLGGAYGLLKD